MWFFSLLALVLAIWALSRTGRIRRELDELRSKSDPSRLLYRINSIADDLARLKKGQPAGAAAPGAESPPEEKAEPPVPAEVIPGITPSAPAEIEEDELLAPCPHCGMKVRRDSKFCYFCGWQMREPAVSGEPIPAPSPLVPKAEIPAAPASRPSSRTSWADLEEKLGANWLNKIGIVAFVIGAALLINYSWYRLGPAGKIFLGYTLGVSLLAAGVLGQRKEWYRPLARALIGGGWALTYFTTYALHNVPAARLVQSDLAGFLLLFVVAAAMVAHSLRYDSQVVTGIAYLLGFTTVAISSVTLTALASSALLAASLVVVLWKRRWFDLEPWAVGATFCLHWYWLYDIFEKQGGRGPFLESSASILLLTFYWGLFLVSHFLRQHRNRRELYLLTTSFLLNAGLYLAVMGYQSLYPELRFWFLLGVGTVYLALSWLSKRIAGRLSFVLTSTLGAVLVFAAIPYKFSDARLEILWLAEAEALLFIGWRLAERQLRRLGWLASAVVAGYVVVTEVIPQSGYAPAGDTGLGILLLAFAAAFFSNARLTPARLGSGAGEWDRLGVRFSPPVATGLLLAAGWILFPAMWVAPVWLAMGVAVRELGRKLEDPVWEGSGFALALLPVARLMTVNLHDPSPYLWGGISLRLLTMGLTIAGLYAYGRRLRLGLGIQAPASNGPRFAWATDHPAVFTWAATGLSFYLIWYEVTNTAVGLAWAMLGLALVEIARPSSYRPLALQGFTLMALSFSRIFFVDLNAVEALFGPLSGRLLTVPVLAGIFYYSATAMRAVFPRLRTALLWFGMISLAVLLRFELPEVWVAVGWAALAPVFYFAGERLGDSTWRLQSYVLAILAGVRGGLYNFSQDAAWWFTNQRTATILLVCVIFYATLVWVLARRGALRGPAGAGVSRSSAGSIRGAAAWLDASPHQLFFFVPSILLTVLITVEVLQGREPGWLTAAWGLEGVVIFAAFLRQGELSYRWFSLLLLMMCVGRIVAVDIWAIQDPLGRIASFIGLGAAALAVNFLYLRFRETWKRYL